MTQIMKYTLYLILVSPLFFFSSIKAATITAVKTGDWNSTDTWDLGRVPLSTDDVMIDGFYITIPDGIDADAASVTTTDETSGASTGLEMNGNSTLSVVNNFIVNHDINTPSVQIELNNNAILTVGGNVVMTRSTTTMSISMLRLRMRNSAQMTVEGTFDFIYNGGSGLELSSELEIEGQSILTVKGLTSMTMNNAGSFWFEANGNATVNLQGGLETNLNSGTNLYVTSENNSQFNITGNANLMNMSASGKIWLLCGELTSSDGGSINISGDLILNSSTIDAEIEVSARYDESAFSVDGNLEFTGLSEGDVYVNLLNGSTFALGGKISQTGDFGRIDMSANAELKLTGQTAFEFPVRNKNDGNTDKMDITNLILDLGTGNSVTLSSDYTIEDKFELVSGTINTSSSAMLIIADGASITGGSDSAYINGPLKKIGSTNGSNFIFPIGNAGSYGPLEISAMTNSASEYTASYQTDPPPFGTMSGGLDHVSNIEYWELDRATGSEAVTLTLHWTDADRSNIVDTTALYVAGLIGGTWTDFGRQTSSGTLGTGGSGSITAYSTDPPPFGTQTFTFASSNGLNALPIFFESMRAEKRTEDIIDVNWITSLEINSSHFILERSSDGQNWVPIARKAASGNSSSSSFYTYEDKDYDIGNNYYRLQMFDLDGTYTYSPVVVVVVSTSVESAVPIISPNPSTGYIRIFNESLQNGSSYVEVYDYSGKLVFEGEKAVIDHEIEFDNTDLQRLLNGQYYTVIRQGQNRSVIQFTLSRR